MASASQLEAATKLEVIFLSPVARRNEDKGQLLGLSIEGKKAGVFDGPQILFLTNDKEIV